MSLSVATTWQVTFDQLQPAARTLLEMLAWLAPDPLPHGLLEHAETEAQVRGASGVTEADVEEALAELRRYSLLSRPDADAPAQCRARASPRATDHPRPAVRRTAADDAGGGAGGGKCLHAHRRLGMSARGPPSNHRVRTWPE